MADGARARSAPLSGTVLGRYSIGRLLGEGGMGSVYEATHQELGRRVAIKTLHERYAVSPDARQRFLREGRAAAQVRHPNVADVYDVAIEDSCPYLVLELLDGEDVGSLIAREGALSAQRTADILIPVVAALAAAHDLGIVHRDLKPENIFLAQGRGSVVPKVLDFGISKLTDGEPLSLTGTGAVLGTPHYMSPEQALATKRVDARSDQYSLGVVLYHCATGRRPLDGVPLYSLIQRTVHGDFPPPRQVHPALSSAFEEVILRAMARDPERRFSSTRALGQALLPFASDGVRAAYADELTGAAPPASAPPSPGPLTTGQSSTFGESALIRAVPEKPQRSGVGVFIGALLVAALLLVWRFGPWAQRPTLSPRAAPDVATAQHSESSAQALRPADSAGARASSPAAPVPNGGAEGAAALVAEAEQNLARGELARAVDAFRRAYALSLQPSALGRAADAQTQLWRAERGPGECRTARDLWLAYLAAVSEPGADARAKLAELGDCGASGPQGSSVGEPRAAARPVQRPRVAPAAAPTPRPAPTPAAPAPTSPRELTPPTAVTPALPSDDPDDGFVDIQRRETERARK